ncbi:hypothetical protein Rsub_10976 [Raphidocelis subcapitata]|uniref:MYND-type domain-containing protein n=1 Tax=Raphidocelis subcapitata TaxID=307507 RepID=A0A2V0PJZ5_9CHLO|nr:hypothetical protein Rsub_10976 [Raphidocelis subcapitata]|eukprot:GBF98313.1 hypothetical protein Rsub_10976 [Raphidocelis subcapitata]
MESLAAALASGDAAAAAAALAGLPADAATTAEHGAALLAADGALPALVSALGSGNTAAAAAASRCLRAAALGAPLAERIAGAGGALPALARRFGGGDAAAGDALRAVAAAGHGACVAAAAAELLAPAGGAGAGAADEGAAGRARALLLAEPLSLPEVAVDALARCAATTSRLRARVQALEALLAAAAAEAAARPEACAAGACRKSGADVRLKPCAGCQGGPAGRILYCSPQCQRADWQRHKPYCRAAAAAAVGGAPAP